MVQTQYPSDHPVATVAAAVTGSGDGGLLGLGFRYDLGDTIGIDGGESVYFQDRQEHIVERLVIEGYSRDDGHLAFDAGINQKIPSGCFADCTNYGLDFGIDQV